MRGREAKAGAARAAAATCVRRDFRGFRPDFSSIPSRGRARKRALSDCMGRTCGRDAARLPQADGTGRRGVHVETMQVGLTSRSADHGPARNTTRWWYPRRAGHEIGRLRSRAPATARSSARTATAPIRRRPRAAKIAHEASGLVYGVVVGLTQIVQRQLQYHAHRRIYSPLEGSVPQMSIVRFHAADGVQLISWHHAAAERRRLLRRRNRHRPILRYPSERTMPRRRGSALTGSLSVSPTLCCRPFRSRRRSLGNGPSQPHAYRGNSTIVMVVIRS